MSAVLCAVALFLLGLGPGLAPQAARAQEAGGSDWPALAEATIHRGVQELPFEIRLRRLSFTLLKEIRRRAVRFYRVVQRTADSWLRSLLTGVGLLILAALVSVADVRLLTVWRQQGRRVASIYIAIGMGVFLRLLWEPRVAGWSRIAVLAAVAYGVLQRDLLTDRAIPFGWLDDVVVVCLVSYWFIRRCPSELIEEHAAHVRRQTARLLSTSPMS